MSGVEVVTQMNCPTTSFSYEKINSSAPFHNAVCAKFPRHTQTAGVTYRQSDMVIQPVLCSDLHDTDQQGIGKASERYSSCWRIGRYARCVCEEILLLEQVQKTPLKSTPFVHECQI